MELLHNKFGELKEFGYDPAYGKFCDHTVLRAYTPYNIIKDFCDEAKKADAASVCVNPIHVAAVHKELEGSGIMTACVIGFPLGANKTCVKALEAAEAAKDGADELDMVINIGALRSGDYDCVLNDIKAVVEAGKPAKVKVIIETCYLTDEEKKKAVELSIEAGAICVKTSTGMGPGGATVHDVELMRETAGDRVLVKASGGVDNRAKAYEFIKAGADRLGCSRALQIVHDDMSLDSASKHNQPPKFD